MPYPDDRSSSKGGWTSGSSVLTLETNHENVMQKMGLATGDFISAIYNIGEDEGKINSRSKCQF
jgi:hypothetical protein